MIENINGKNDEKRIYKSVRIIDGKPKYVIVDENGKVINKYPNNEELKLAKHYDYKVIPKTDEIKPTIIPINKNNKHGNLRYKIIISTDEQNFFWITIDDGIVAWNPTGEDLKGAIVKSYNKTNMCELCIKENNITDKSILYPGNAKKWINREGVRTDKWVCNKHWARDYNHSPSGILSLQKSLRHRRLGIQNPDSPNAIGDRGERLTDMIFRTTRLSVKDDCYNGPLDHSQIPKGTFVKLRERLIDISEKIPQTKIANFTIDIGTNGGWFYKYRTIEHKKRYDIMILWCISKDKLSIERGYIIPKDMTNKIISIGIIKDPSRIVWYDEYRIIDENILEQINEYWRKIKYG